MKNPKCEKEYGDYYKTYYMSDDEKDIDMTFNILVLDDDSYNSYASDAGISNSGDKAILINKGVYTIYDDKAEKYINKELRQFDYKSGDTLKCEYSTDSGQGDDKDRDIYQLTESVDITLAGVTDKQFYKMVRLESLFISVKSLVIGVPAGLVITYIINVMENRMDTVVVYVLPVEAVIMCVIVVIVLIYAIMNLSMSKIRHQNVIETIKNENL